MQFDGVHDAAALQTPRSIPAIPAFQAGKVQRPPTAHLSHQSSTGRLFSASQTTFSGNALICCLASPSLAYRPKGLKATADFDSHGCDGGSEGQHPPSGGCQALCVICSGRLGCLEAPDCWFESGNCRSMGAWFGRWPALQRRRWRELKPWLCIVTGALRPLNVAVGPRTARQHALTRWLQASSNLGVSGQDSSLRRFKGDAPYCAVATLVDALPGPRLYERRSCYHDYGQGILPASRSCSCPASRRRSPQAGRSCLDSRTGGHAGWAACLGYQSSTDSGQSAPPPQWPQRNPERLKSFPIFAPDLRDFPF